MCATAPHITLKGRGGMAIEVLLNPAAYSEADIQAAISTLWPAIFPEYRLTSRSDVRDGNWNTLPSSWLPDLIGVKPDDENNEGGEFLLIELKGRPPAGSKAEAIAQVVGYAQTLREVLPDWPIRLLVIGPYRHKEAGVFEKFEVDGFSGAIMMTEELGRRILWRAETALDWLCTMPLSGCLVAFGPDHITRGFSGSTGLGKFLRRYVPLNESLTWPGDQEQSP